MLRNLSVLLMSVFQILHPFFYPLTVPSRIMVPLCVDSGAIHAHTGIGSIPEFSLPSVRGCSIATIKVPVMMVLIVKKVHTRVEFLGSTLYLNPTLVNIKGTTHQTCKNKMILEMQFYRIFLILCLLKMGLTLY